jgi:hypothetical protein
MAFAERPRTRLVKALGDDAGVEEDITKLALRRWILRGDIVILIGAMYK